MHLKPLEFSDCLADSPWFHQNIHTHESTLDDAAKQIKSVEQQCRRIVHCASKLSQAQKALAETLNKLRIDTVGNTQTDDERVLASCINDFGTVIIDIEIERSKIVQSAERLYLEPLQNLYEGIHHVIRDERQKYNKESSKFYSSLDKHLNLSTAKKNDFTEADIQLGKQQELFCRASLNYVAKIQSIRERLKFEFAEILSAFLFNWLSFYHVGHLMHKDFTEVYDGISSRAHRARENYETTLDETDRLKERMLIAHIQNGVFPASGTSVQSAVLPIGDFPLPPPNTNIKQGYMNREEKSLLAKTRDVLAMPKWNRYYCVYSRETRIFTMIPINSTAKTDMKGALEQSSSFKLKSCVRRAGDSIDKRFCLDVVPEERNEVITLQALSEEDRRQWLDAMDGREPTYLPGNGVSPSGTTFSSTLDDNGFEFVRQCLTIIEEKGIKEQGIYRNCGVTSKVQKLLHLGLDKRKNSNIVFPGSNPDNRLNLLDEEWEIRTISSAVKTFLRNLPEPLMTFDLHNQFINAAKMHNVLLRVDHIHYYVYKLPERHREMLEIIIRHLKRVADLSHENLMTVGNLGVCFGPTLLRPREETMAAIMDIKFCNVVVEVLISNCQKIFDTKPPERVSDSLCPPKPSHNLVAVMPNEAATTSTTSIAGGQQSHRNKSSPVPPNNLLLPAGTAVPPSLISSINDLSFADDPAVASTPLRSDPYSAHFSASVIMHPSIINRPTGTPPPRPRSIAASASTTTTTNNNLYNNSHHATLVRQRQQPTTHSAASQSPSVVPRSSVFHGGATTTTATPIVPPLSARQPAPLPPSQTSNISAESGATVSTPSRTISNGNIGTGVNSSNGSGSLLTASTSTAGTGITTTATGLSVRQLSAQFKDLRQTEPHPSLHPHSTSSLSSSLATAATNNKPHPNHQHPHHHHPCFIHSNNATPRDSLWVFSGGGGTNSTIPADQQSCSESLSSVCSSEDRSSSGCAGGGPVSGGCCFPSSGQYSSTNTTATPSPASARRSKISGPYAPSYNPMASEK